MAHQLVITLHDGQTVHAELSPEDERRLTEQFGDGSTFQITSADDDLEGHAFAGQILVNVLDHSIPVRLPNAADAANLQRSLVIGALTATIVGVVAMTAVPDSIGPAGIDEAAANHTLNVPAMAVRAQRNQMAQEQAFYLSNVPLDVNNPAIPAQALRAEQAEMAREQSLEDATVAGSASVQTSNASAQLDVNNPAIPAQAKRAGTQ